MRALSPSSWATACCATFGWPRANEDDAERAVRAGLAIIDSVRTTKAPDGSALATRIGIATGVVIVGDLIGSGATQEAAVVGETPNLAARLQGVAGPNQLVCPAKHGVCWAALTS